MKEKISLYLVATVKRIGALWVGFLVSLVPLYVLRASIHDLDTRAFVEPLASYLIVVLSAALFLFLLYRRDDDAAKMNHKGIVSITVIPTVIHLLLCVLICWSKYVYFLLSAAYSITHLLAPGAHDITEQAIWSVLVASVMVTPIPAVGVCFGCLSARKKRQKEIEKLHREGEVRQKQSF